MGRVSRSGPVVRARRRNDRHRLGKSAEEDFGRDSASVKPTRPASSPLTREQGGQPVSPLAAGNRRPSITTTKSYPNGQGNDPLTMMVLPSAKFPAIPVRVTCETISM